VADLVTLGDDIKPAATPGEVSGVTLIGGEQVEVVDTYWLFAQSLAGGPGEDKPVCALPTADPWMNTILRPIIEGAGYRVVGLAEADAADILITSAEDDDIPPLRAGEVVRIRRPPRAAAKRTTASTDMIGPGSSRH
jgi:two-component system chemotaxis sensor kinase CheA